MKLRGSGGFYVRAYPFEKQEAFFDGHIKCFEFMNGVPYKIAYDNLKTAVKKILEGSNREEQEQFIAYEPITFMNLHSAGRQKGAIKWCRECGQRGCAKVLRSLPEVDSFEELNEYLHNECIKLLESNPKWEAERAALRPLPAVRFDGASIKRQRSTAILWYSLKLTDTLFHDICGRESHC